MVNSFMTKGSRIYNKEGTLYSIISVEKTGQPHAKE